MEATAYLLAVIGGFMMGLAILWLFKMLKDGNAERKVPAGRQENPWKVIAAFAAGVPLGAWGISRLINGLQSGSMLPLLALGLTTALATFLVARAYRRH